jgi:hypothetical protein
MSQATHRSQDILVMASGLLGAQPKDVFVEDISARFPWLTRYRAYWAQTHEDRRNIVILVGESGTPLVTTAEAGLKVVSLVLTQERGSLPDGLSATVLAEAIRKLTVSPQGLVASRALLTSDNPSLDSWLRSEAGPPEQQLRTLRQLCIDPVLQVDSRSGSWTLTFLYFNEHGGVERWDAMGDAQGITKASQAFAAPNGTFNWPYE